MENNRIDGIGKMKAGKWPFLLRIPPGTLVAVVLGWLLIVWIIFIAIDIMNLIDIELSQPVWTRLFNDRPVEWSQWFLLAFAIVASAYLAGKLDAGKKVMAARFFFLLAIGLGLMLIEDAGDIRHTLSSWLHEATGPFIFGLPHRVVSDVPYFAALAAVPLYAVFRYGSYAWESAGTRFYLPLGVIFYALAAVCSGLRHLGDFYIKVGLRLDSFLFGGRFPVPDGMTQERAHFFIVDSVIEESVELLAVTMIFAAILAYARNLRFD